MKNSLEKIWIFIELHPVSVKGLLKTLNNKDEYDIILAGINLWYFEQNIFPYFHSSQVDNWYNFSNTKKSLLDSLLEDLKEDLKNKEDEDSIKNKILDFITEEQVVKTLYSPKQKLIVDKNIKISPFPQNVQNVNLRTILYDRLYTNEKKVIDLWSKSTLGFIKYITGKIYE
jgi:ABC-type oligopeptide transport system substrate-binding subunit